MGALQAPSLRHAQHTPGRVCPRHCSTQTLISQTWNGRVIPRQRSAAAAANGDGDGAPAASRAETSSQAESSSSHQPPATHPSHALAVAWEAALWQSVSLKAWRGLLSASGPAAPQEPAVYRTVPPPGAIRYAPWPRFSPDWEERHLQLLKRVFLPGEREGGSDRRFCSDHATASEGHFCKCRSELLSPNLFLFSPCLEPQRFRTRSRCFRATTGVCMRAFSNSSGCRQKSCAQRGHSDPLPAAL